jgi:SAM-dependent methyltransferase
MRRTGGRSGRVWIGALVLSLAAGPALVGGPLRAQEGAFEPEIGQAGKDVVWVPTPEILVEAMLDLAEVTPADVVVDLGSGDGRNVIAAARRGARARGVEYNPEMVELSRRRAAEAGVAGRAEFVEGDMFAADFSDADVLALFLLPSNLLRLRPKFLALAPGTRIVSNTFTIQDWDADETLTLEDGCTDWCAAYLYIVPARVEGSWRLDGGRLELTQQFQQVSGTLTRDGATVPVAGSLRGETIVLTAGDQRLTGRVDGDVMAGSVEDGGRAASWRATRRR